MENGNKERKIKTKKEIKYFVKRMFKIQQQKKGKQRPLRYDLHPLFVQYSM